MLSGDEKLLYAHKFGSFEYILRWGAHADFDREMYELFYWHQICVLFCFLGPWNWPYIPHKLHYFSHKTFLSCLRKFAWFTYIIYNLVYGLCDITNQAKTCFPSVTYCSFIERLERKNISDHEIYPSTSIFDFLGTRDVTYVLFGLFCEVHGTVWILFRSKKELHLDLGENILL